MNDEKPLTRRFIENVKRGYMGEISYTDYHINMLRETLIQLGLEQNTLIVITADHGESFAENDFWGHGGSVNDPSIRIPLIFNQPGRLPSGIELQGLCESIDVMPTILAHLGIDGPPDMQGRSLVPYMGGSGSLPNHGGYSEAMGSEDEAMWVRSLVRKDWKYVHSPSGGWEALYHLADDPAEEWNVMADFPEVTAEMRDELLSVIETRSSSEGDAAAGIDEETENALRALGYVR
jgi:arylsulfatase A-like enzyme